VSTPYQTPPTETKVSIVIEPMSLTLDGFVNEFN
jgi:hypothetical protein